MRYAIKSNGNWYVCVAAKQKDYDKNHPMPEDLVWSEVGSTAYICAFGDQERIVELD